MSGSCSTASITAGIIMSIFKTMVQQDTDTVIFNLEELADIHELDGRQIPVIFDEVTLEKMKAQPKYADGYNTATRLILVRPTDLPGKPAEGAHLTLDGKTYLVKSVTGRLIWRIALEANR